MMMNISRTHTASTVTIAHRIMHAAMEHCTHLVFYINTCSVRDEKRANFYMTYFACKLKSCAAIL